MADSGYHSEKNMELVFKENIDAYVADRNFRQRDSWFASADRYKQIERQRNGQPGKLFQSADFIFADDFSFCLCSAGKRLYRRCRNVRVKHCQAIKFKGPKSSCVPCGYGKNVFAIQTRLRFARWPCRSDQDRRRKLHRADEAEDRYSDRQDHLLPATGNRRTTICPYAINNEIGSVYVAKQEKGQYTVESLLHYP